jgi:hypothetical protein
MPLFIDGVLSNGAAVLLDASGVTGDYAVRNSGAQSTNTYNGKTSLTINCSSNTRYDRPSTAATRKPATLAMWINPNSIAANGGAWYQKDTIEATGYGYRAIQLDGTTKKLVHVVGSGTSAWQSSPSISTGVWTHICYVSGTWGSKLYLNGTLDSTNALTWFSNAAGTDETHVIGSWDTGQNFWHGFLDDYRIYTNELSATEVQGLYNGSPTGR